MPEIQLLNDAGYNALLTLAESEPRLFIQGDPDELRQRMEQAGREEHGPDAELYGARLNMSVPLADLNRLQKGGPNTDAMYAPIMRSAIGTSVVQAADSLLWATINCFELPKYVPVRWQSSNLNQATYNFVHRRYLQYSGSDGRKWNAAARLWWLGEMATRAAEHSKHSQDDLLAEMARNVNLYHQTIDRTFLSSNPRLLAAVWDVFLDGNEHLRTTKDANELMTALNLRAATLSFDFLDYDELRAVVEEAKPKKEP
ncbi:MAG: DUF6339 family protein [Chloroflexota bacterium]|nr:DUF6339 family protein [Chloroflexota bacterium]MDE2959460.1 DUF6339 family protein [Chloroflexota bacterium]